MKAGQTGCTAEQESLRSTRRYLAVGRARSRVRSQASSHARSSARNRSRQQNREQARVIHRELGSSVIRRADQGHKRAIRQSRVSKTSQGWRQDRSKASRFGSRESNNGISRNTRGGGLQSSSNLWIRLLTLSRPLGSRICHSLCAPWRVRYCASMFAASRTHMHIRMVTILSA